MKHPAGEFLAAAVGKLLAESRAAELFAWQPEIIVPIPMHWRRRLSRGANNPELLAAALGRRLGIPTAIGSVTRFVLTRPQNELPPEDRAANIRGAFRIDPSWNFEARGCCSSTT